MFIHESKAGADFMVRKFMEIARQIGLTIAEEKTEWGTSQLTFLGILVLGKHHRISIPDDK